MSKKAWSGRRFVYCAVVVVFATGLLASWPTSEAHGQGLPEAPRLFVDTTYAPPGGRNWCVLVQAPPPGCTSQPDFQTALDNAVPGDVIILQAGTTYTVTGTNPFTLPNRCVPPCNQWIYIQSSAYASLPPPGTRATSAHASFMAKLDGRGSTVLQGGSYVRLIGLEITSATSGAIVDLSGANHVVVDRSWVHGTPSGDVQRGIQANGSWIAVVDSAISNIHHQTNDAQAINAYDGWGPFKIVNDYLEASGENVMFGGWDPTTSGLVPSDIEIRGNYFIKPLSWRVDDPSHYAGINWVVKNLLELKNARRALVEGNIFEQNWQEDQQGFAILFTVRNQAGTCTWCVVEDVIFRDNIVRHVAAGIQFLGWDNLQPSAQTKRILVQDNLWTDIGGSWGIDSGSGPGPGTLFWFQDGTADVVINHNTAFQTGNIIFAGCADSLCGQHGHKVHTGFVFTNNIVPHNTFGVVGDGPSPGSPTLNEYFTGYVFRKNILEDGGANNYNYPPENFFPPSWSDVRFVDQTNGNYRLDGNSAYKNAGTDCKDTGADIDAVERATLNVDSGSRSADAYPPIIYGVKVASATSTSALIVWSTDEPGTSQVEYGTPACYGNSTSVDNAMVTSHAVTVTPSGGFTIGMIYHYRVKSNDAASNLATFYDLTFAIPTASDDFNRPDSTDLGANWAPTTVNSCQIVGNKIRSSVLSAPCRERYAGIAWPADQYSQVRLVAGTTSSAGGGPAVRMSSGDTAYFAAGGELRRVLSGSPVTLGSYTAAVGDTVRLEAIGSELRVKVNGTLRLTVTDMNISSGDPGITNWASVNLADAEIDDWAGGSLSPQLASDDFNRPDSTDLGTNWAVVSSCSLQIVGNRVRATATTDACIERYTGVTWPADQWSQVVIRAMPGAVGGGPGPAVRCAASGNTCYFAETSAAGGKLWRTNNGAYTQLATFAAANVGDTLRLEVFANELRVKVNGETRLIYTETSSSALLSGSAGIKVKASTLTPTTDAELDDWAGGSVSP